MQNSWKQQNLVDPNSRATVQVHMPFSSLSQWVQVKRHLAQVNLIKSVNLQEPLAQQRRYRAHLSRRRGAVHPRSQNQADLGDLTASGERAADHDALAGRRRRHTVAAACRTTTDSRSPPYRNDGCRRGPMRAHDPDLRWLARARQLRFWLIGLVVALIAVTSAHDPAAFRGRHGDRLFPPIPPATGWKSGCRAPGRPRW